jgi:hypothetical protein
VFSPSDVVSVFGDGFCCGGFGSSVGVPVVFWGWILVFIVIFVPFFSFRLWFGVVVTVGVGFHFHGLRVAFSGWQRSIGGYGSSG